MSAAGRLQAVLQSMGIAAVKPEEAEQLAAYLALLLRWNTKMNLTAVRDEESMLRRHFAESIQCARSIPSGVESLLDYGSGGGFPGIPCAICRPEIRVTLAESQGKKAAFLREATRSLQLEAKVYGGRVEDLPSGICYDAVTLRAVDRMSVACRGALTRVRPGGCLMILTTKAQTTEIMSGLIGVAWEPVQELRGSEQQVLAVGKHIIGT